MQLFHYRQDGVDRGPYSLDQVLSMWQRGMIRPGDEIRADDSNTWRNASEWMRHAGSKKSSAYNVILEEQAPVDVIAKSKSFPYKGLAIVALMASAGLWTVHWGWTLGFGLFALTLLRPTYRCGTCQNEVAGSSDWCSRCGSHLKP